MKPVEAYLLAVLRGKPGLFPAALRGLLAALSHIYTVGLKVYLLPYDIGIRKRTRLPCPVLCVGNLTTGGTGKTPVTQAVCRMLLAEGKRVCILSRGYRGANEFGCAVVSNGNEVLLTVQEAGDEAFLLAQTLPGVPVVVGKDRRKTGALACAQFAPDVIVMDDGLQYWQLHRDLNIVLLNAAEPFDNGYTLPRGLLREPPSHLKRAGAVLLTQAQRIGEAEREALKARVGRLAPGCPVFEANFAPLCFTVVSDREVLPLSWSVGRRVALFSAIGNPALFEKMIVELGGVVTESRRYRDHEAIPLPELESLFAEASRLGAEAVVTTEKDAVKLPPLKPPIPLVALQVAMQIENEAGFLSVITSPFANKKVT